MEYSLRDAGFLFWLIKEKSIPMPLIYYQSEYIFFDTHSYILAINEPNIKSQQIKRLHEHLEKAKYIREMANYSDVGGCNNALYISFFKSSHSDKFHYEEIVNMEVKGKPAKRYHCLTYLLELDLETSKPKWVVSEESYKTEKEWKKMWSEYLDVYERKPTIHQIPATDIFIRLCDIINELNHSLDIKKEHPHKAIIESLIPNHVSERYREELEHIFSNGKFNNEQVQWLSGYKELQVYLRPHYDNGTIPHQHSQNWYDFAIKNFTQKNGRPLNKKTLQNAPTRQNSPPNSSRTTQNPFPNPSQTVPDTFPKISFKVQLDYTGN